MSMKFVHFDSGTVLIIAIAILYSYFEQPWSPVHCLYGLHICFTIQPGPFGSLWSKPEVCSPFKAFKHVNEVSYPYYNFDSPGTVH